MIILLKLTCILTLCSLSVNKKQLSLNLKKFKYISWELSHIQWNRSLYKNSNIKTLKIWNRRTYSFPSKQIRKIAVHKGSKWITIKLHKLKSQFKVGVFAFTRKPFYHPITKKKK